MRAWVGVAAVLVRVYDVSGQPDEDRRAALELAREVLAEAGVNAVFRNCTGPETVAAVCDSVPAAGERIVRIINSPVPPKSPHAPLGNAVIDTRTNSGVYATVYFDRVAQKASGGVDRRVLVGRTIAHELGHLLMGKAAHSQSGLMREFWTDQELRRDEPPDWMFAAEDKWRLCMKNVVRNFSRCARPSNGP